MMKLYSNPMSPNDRRVRLTAAVLGITLEEQVLDFAKGEHKSADYLALNPNGAVPTLVDGAFVLTESRAIMQYLAAKKPESGLLPRDEAARADVTRWQFWDAVHFSPHVGTIVFEKLLKGMFGMGEPDDSAIQQSLVKFRRFAGVLNTVLNGKTFIVGDALSLADLTLGSTLMYSQQAELPLAEFPNIERWFSRITQLEGWKQTAG